MIKAGAWISTACAPARDPVDGDGMVEPVAEEVGGPADLHGDLTASGLVEGVDAIEHATLDDPSLDRRAPGSCQSKLARSSISSMTTEVAPAVGYA
jgi:hypothetical protein